MENDKEGLISNSNGVKIRTFKPEDINYIIKKHRQLYETEYGFSSQFGDYVAVAVNKFAESHDSSRENIWIAEVNGREAGVIAIVKVDESTAQLRWFLVEPEMRDRGIGHKLMETAIEFCKEKDYKHVFLWTVNILEAARHLYKSFGFKLTETRDNRTWSDEIIIEERWDLIFDF